jgi:hypothetical protein
MFLLLSAMIVPLALTGSTRHPGATPPPQGRNAAAVQRRTGLESNVSPLEAEGKHVRNPILGGRQHPAVCTGRLPVPALLYDGLQVKPSPPLL